MAQASTKRPKHVIVSGNEMSSKRFSSFHPFRNSQWRLKRILSIEIPTLKRCQHRALPIIHTAAKCKKIQLVIRIFQNHKKFSPSLLLKLVCSHFLFSRCS
mmetsp:Transcript_21552/g.44971  ORF Transcript_21552/g.44971 Transcript_21552/m.44971 type:complete len:101 (+) Transcript_21552:1621-1923(+)